MKALITGGNRGIGLEVARQMARKDYEVVLSARDPQKGQHAADKLKAEGLNVRFLPLDLANDRSIHALATTLNEEEKGLDVLINNAGIHYDSFQQARNPDFRIVDEAMRINFIGPWKLAVALLPLMEKVDNPRIVNVSSGAGALTDMGEGTPAYSASKAALNVLTIKLSAELTASGFKVNAVCPGWVRTDMGGPSAPRSVEEGAASVVWAADLDKHGPSGGFYRDGKPIDW